MKILTYPNPLLKQKCKPIVSFDDDLRSIVGQMLRDVQGAKGLALAAPQVGILKRFFVVSSNVELDGFPSFIGNPVITKPSGTTSFEEGCLSIPNTKIRVARYKSFVLEYQDEYGNKNSLKVTGLAAIMCQHEIDHLDGKLLID